MIVGYTMLHYGVDYLAYALTSLRDYVDKHVILYSGAPTFGSRTDLPCPDSRQDLLSIAKSILGNKLLWCDDLPQNYDTVLQLIPHADLILELDADEVMPEGMIVSVLRQFKAGALRSRRYRLPMVHHWRSFNYICADGSWPIRLCVPKTNDSEAMYPYLTAPIHHFGYARSVADMRYKIETSAHRGEWRPGWWNDVFLRFPERLTDLHPVVNNMWNAQPFDKHNLPGFMHTHPWFDAEVIA